MTTMGNNTRYDGMMDKECIPLCDAINNIPGLRTVGSCSGHGKNPFRIYMEGKSVQHRNFLILMRALDRRYGGPWEWQIQLITTDMTEDPMRVLISSESSVGEAAYQQSLQVVDSIKVHLNHEAFQKAFRVGKYLETFDRNGAI